MHPVTTFTCSMTDFGGGRRPFSTDGLKTTLCDAISLEPPPHLFQADWFLEAPLGDDE